MPRASERQRPPEFPAKSVMDFRGRLLPESGELVGYAALIDYFKLKIPLPSRLAAVARRHHPNSTPAWAMFSPRHRPTQDFNGHLTFAIKWEGIDLSVLSALFAVTGPRLVQNFVRETPTGMYARRAWFIFEWLTGREIDIPDPGKVRAVPALDPGFQFAVKIGDLSQRHRVINNMPGTPRFCPLVRRTPALALREADRLDERAREIVARLHPDIMRRAASFLLLSDTKASFAIEKERPSGSKAVRWANAIAQAGVRPLSIAELLRLQTIVIDDRSVELGLREEGGFIGDHDRLTLEPVPEHISAKAEDLEDLLQGMIDFGTHAVTRQLNPVIAATAIAFGFVYIHPFVDGNGRIHRWLIQHILSHAGFGAPGVVLPVSAAMHRDQIKYRDVLRSYSEVLLPLVEWRPTARNNVEVLNATADYYRFFDATAHAEYLYDCLAQTLEKDLPDEVNFLHSFDRFSAGVQQFLDLTSKQVEQLRRFLHDQGGHLSKRARAKEFEFLTLKEVADVERIYAETFGRNPS